MVVTLGVGSILEQSASAPLHFSVSSVRINPESCVISVPKGK
jgi:hypothetical protein